MDKIKITTPEHIELEYDLAGLGSRFVAYLVDAILQGAVLAILFLTLIFSSPGILENNFHNILSNIMAGVLMIIGFIVWFGYFIFFETIWTGQSPGKRLAQIQVIKDNGEPIGFVDSFLRNVFRIIDFLPWYFILGIILILINKQNKRLGDMVAKTIVVKLKSDIKPAVLPRLDVQSDIHVDVNKINEEEYGLIRNFIIRRNDLQPAARKKLADKIADLIKKRMEQDFSEVDNEELLEVIAVQYREQKKLI